MVGCIYYMFAKDYKSLALNFSFLWQHKKYLKGNLDISYLLPRFLMIAAAEVLLYFLILTRELNSADLITNFAAAYIICQLHDSLGHTTQVESLKQDI